MKIYDKKGKLLDYQEGVKLLEDKEYRTVGRTKLFDGTIISTVWLGAVFGLSDPVVLFETRVFDSAGGEQEARGYHTESEAREGHAQAVAAWRLITE